MRLRRERDDHSPTAPQPAPPPPLRIFVNYRREDAAPHALLIYNAMCAKFGDTVFMDVDDIEPGLDFTEVIDETVGISDVVLAVIGKSWIGVTDDAGRLRLQQSNDFVRMELEAALNRKEARVIPVLVDGTEMPSADDLPGDLAKLAHRNAVELRTGASWNADVGRLQDALVRIAEKKAQAAAAAPPRAVPVQRQPQTAVPASVVPGADADLPVGWRLEAYDLPAWGCRVQLAVPSEFSRVKNRRSTWQMGWQDPLGFSKRSPIAATAFNVSESDVPFETAVSEAVVARRFVEREDLELAAGEAVRVRFAKKRGEPEPAGGGEFTAYILDSYFFPAPGAQPGHLLVRFKVDPPKIHQRAPLFRAIAATIRFSALD